MGPIAVLVLCIVVALSFSCYDDYYFVLNAMLDTKNFKCTGNHPFDAGNPCVSLQVDTMYKGPFLGDLSSCMAVDTSEGYHSYTYLADWPPSLLSELSHIIYRYTYQPDSSPAIAELITEKSFGITASDYEDIGSQYSRNTDISADIINASWVFSTKYVIDYWIQKYEANSYRGFHTSLPGFKIHPLFILNCIATTDVERRDGMYIETIFNRINDMGVGIGYNPSDPDDCHASALPSDLRFVAHPIQYTNRGGLIQLMKDDFVPIVPISFDLNSLRYMKSMSIGTHSPILRQSNQPSLFGVLNSFNSAVPDGGAYWEVITNILPAMAIRLVLQMSDDTTDSNTHGIAAFAVGVKLNNTPVFLPSLRRECDEQSFHAGCKELVLNPSLCSDVSMTTLDLSSVELPGDAYGVSIPEGMDCRHITEIVLPPLSDWYCAFASDTITPSLFHSLFGKCMVIEASSMSAADTESNEENGGRRLQPTDLNLGYIATGANRNTKVKSVHLNPGSYSAFSTMKFEGMDQLEILVIGKNTSVVASFSTVSQIVIEDCPQLSRVIIGGQSSFNNVGTLSLSLRSDDISVAASDGCPDISSAAPYSPDLDVYVTNSFPWLSSVRIQNAPCFRNIRIVGDESGGILSSFNITQVGGVLLNNILFSGSHA